MWETGSFNWAQFMLYWFIRFPEFATMSGSLLLYFERRSKQYMYMYVSNGQQVSHQRWPIAVRQRWSGVLNILNSDPKISSRNTKNSKRPVSSSVDWELSVKTFIHNLLYRLISINHQVLNTHHFSRIRIRWIIFWSFTQAETFFYEKQIESVCFEIWEA